MATDGGATALTLGAIFGSFVIFGVSLQDMSLGAAAYVCGAAAALGQTLQVKGRAGDRINWAVEVGSFLSAFLIGPFVSMFVFWLGRSIGVSSDTSIAAAISFTGFRGPAALDLLMTITNKLVFAKFGLKEDSKDDKGN